MGKVAGKSSIGIYLPSKMVLLIKSKAKKFNTTISSVVEHELKGKELKPVLKKVLKKKLVKKVLKKKLVKKVLKK